MVGQAETDISSQIAQYEILLGQEVIGSLNTTLEVRTTASLTVAQYHGE